MSQKEEDPFIVSLCRIQAGTHISQGLIMALTDEFMTRVGPIPQERADAIIAEFQPQADYELVQDDETQEMLNEIYDSNFDDFF